MAKQPLPDELRELALLATALADQIAAGEEYLRRADMFYDSTDDGYLRRPYPWEHWRMWAEEDGVSEDLATLGAAVMCTAHLNEWPEHLRSECGWHDCGRSMIALAQQDPEQAWSRWGYLLQSRDDFSFDN